MPCLKDARRRAFRRERSNQTYHLRSKTQQNEPQVANWHTESKRYREVREPTCLAHCVALAPPVKTHVRRVGAAKRCFLGSRMAKCPERTCGRRGWQNGGHCGAAQEGREDEGGMGTTCPEKERKTWSDTREGMLNDRTKKCRRGSLLGHALDLAIFLLVARRSLTAAAAPKWRPVRGGWKLLPPRPNTGEGERAHRRATRKPHSRSQAVQLLA